MAHINLSLDDETLATKTDERAWFIGAYVTREIKTNLTDEAKREGRSASQQLIKILNSYYQERQNAITKS